MSKLTKYIKGELKSGSSRKETIKTLVSAGWECEEVEEAMSSVLGGTEGKDDEDKKITKKSTESEKVKLFLLSLIILIMIIIFGVIVLAYIRYEPRFFFELFN